jgi:3,4-dihydroxy 2-butanone 4-phosphate synthase/GTP cyclohydrolase II
MSQAEGEHTEHALSNIEQALADLSAGKMIILVDDETRENEGDLVCASEKITPQIVNFMVKYARGVLCLAMPGEYCDRLNLYPQVSTNSAPMGTAFTITIDADPKFGVSTGVSAIFRSFAAVS